MSDTTVSSPSCLRTPLSHSSPVDSGERKEKETHLGHQLYRQPLVRTRTTPPSSHPPLVRLRNALEQPSKVGRRCGERPQPQDVEAEVEDARGDSVACTDAYSTAKEGFDDEGGGEEDCLEEGGLEDVGLDDLQGGEQHPEKNVSECRLGDRRPFSVGGREGVGRHTSTGKGWGKGSAMKGREGTYLVARDLLPCYCEFAGIRSAREGEGSVTGESVGKRERLERPRPPSAFRGL